MKMKKFLLNILLLIIVNVFVNNVSAFPINPSDTVIMNSDWGDNYGMKIKDGTTFNTFCLESQITFYNNVEYFVESVGYVAVSGGITSTFSDIESVSEINGSSFIATGDPVTNETIWLYASFYDGLFDNFGTGQTLINKVQYAIWFSEEEMSVGSLGELYYNELIDLANGDYTIDGWDIQVVNIVGGPDKDRQSQLVGVNPVPEPSTILLFGCGLIAFSTTIRRKIN